MNKPNILVIHGSIREGRLSDGVAKWFMESIKSYDKANFELYDLKSHPLPMFADADFPSARANPGTHHIPEVQSWLQKVNEADGYIFITAEYNHGIPSALKNALDYGYPEWNNKPAGFVSYGNVGGGVRAVEQLRQVLGELQMFPVREQITIPTIWAAFDEQGNLSHGESNAKTAITIVDKVTQLALRLKGIEYDYQISS